MRRHRRVAFGALIAAGMLLRLEAQQPPIRSGVDTVPIYATVTDRAGSLVTDIPVTDFQVYDNGRRQKIELFGCGSQPITVAILLDRSPSLFDVTSRTQSAVTAFTSRLLPRDRACLGSFGHIVSLHPELTATPTRSCAISATTCRFLPARRSGTPSRPAACALANEGGRRVILVITDAADNCSRTDLSALRSSLERDGVAAVRGRRPRTGGSLAAGAERDGPADRRVVLRAATHRRCRRRRCSASPTSCTMVRYVLAFSPQVARRQGSPNRPEGGARGLTVRRGVRTLPRAMASLRRRSFEVDAPAGAAVAIAIAAIGLAWTLAGPARGAEADVLDEDRGGLRGGHGDRQRRPARHGADEGRLRDSRERRAARDYGLPQRQRCRSPSWSCSTSAAACSAIWG